MASLPPVPLALGALPVSGGLWSRRIVLTWDSVRRTWRCDSASSSDSPSTPSWLPLKHHRYALAGEARLRPSKPQAHDQPLVGPQEALWEQWSTSPPRLDARRLRLALGEQTAIPLQPLVFDTETTGLGASAGTLIALLGVGWWEGGAFCIEQSLLLNPSYERAMLERLAQRCSQSSLGVSYNGKSFDWPLLQTRCTMARLEGPSFAAHLDLLHAARRVLCRSLPRFRLRDLELHLLGWERIGDLPGAEVPERYRRLLRHGDWDAFLPVLNHNLVDILATALLLRRFFELPPPCFAESLAWARLAARRRAPAAVTRQLAATARQQAASPSESASLAWLQAHQARRERDIDGEQRQLQIALAAAPRDHRAAIHLALAKLHEHRKRDYRQAMLHARAGNETAESKACRLARLEKKLRRLQPNTLGG